MSSASSALSSGAGAAPSPAERALVESLALALVREYLAKRKYKATLETLQNELPIKPTPTTTTALAKSLGISKFVAANSKSAAPYPTLLDLFAQFMYDSYGREANAASAAGTEEEEKPRSSSKSAASSSSSSSRSGSSSKSRQSAPEDSDDDLSRQLARSSLARPNSLTAAAAPSSSSSSRSGSSSAAAAAPLSSSSSAGRSSSSSRSDSGSSAASSAYSSSAAAATRPGSASRNGREGSSAASAAPSFAGSSSKFSGGSNGSTTSSRHRSEHLDDDSDLMLEEDVDVDAEIESYDARTKASASSSSKLGASSLFSGSSASGGAGNGGAAAIFATTPVPPSTPLTLDEAHAAKSLIFGSSHLTGTFTDPWLAQGFFFKGGDVTNSVPSLGFGLVQSHGGPCGCLAVVQAYVLKELLFSGASASVPPAKRYALLAPSSPTLARALVHALAEILWMCGDGRAVKCCSRDPRASRMTSARKMSRDSPLFKPDGLSEALAVVELRSLEAVRNFFAVHHAAYTAPQGHGVVLFLYSVILTRGLDAIRADRDENSSLIGAHSYCTQEMVNLMLTGRARSNVFDGQKDLGGLILRGIDARADIGFLSLFEHYENIAVGAHLKCPRLPIWVVCSESHYTVVFSLDAALTTTVPDSQRFDLFYYDQLAQQREEIKLSVDLSKRSAAPKAAGDLEPPINECLRTKWGKNARIDWNGVEPIL